MTYRSSARLFLLVVLALFAIGYVFRYFFLSYYISHSITLPRENTDWQFINQNPLDSALLICAVLFGLYALFHISSSKNESRLAPSYTALPWSVVLLYVSFVVVSLIVRATYGAVLGEQASEAGFIFGTLNYRIQSDLIPPLILLIAEIAWRNGDKRQYYFSLSLLASFYIVLSSITTSKAGMVFFLTQIIIIMYLTSQNILKYPLRIFLSGIAGLLTFILASQLRAEALGLPDSSIWLSLQDGNIVETVFQVAGLIANRIPGVEGLALSCGIDCNTLPSFHLPTLERNAGEIFTNDVIKVQWANDFRSPGFIGGAALFLGLWGGALAAMSLLIASKLFCERMDRWNFSAAAVAAFMFGMVRFMMEGVWYWADIVTMLAGVFTVEFVSRLLREKEMAMDMHMNKSSVESFIVKSVN